MRRVLLMVFAAFCLSAVLLAVLLPSTFAEERLHVASTMAANGDLARAAGYLVERRVVLADRPLIGDASAPLQAVIVIDYAHPKAEQHYEQAVALLEPSVEAGEIFLTHKYVLTPEELSEREGRFLPASTALCGANVRDAHEASFSAAQEGSCDAAPLRSDALETATFRIQGPAVLLGVSGGELQPVWGIAGLSALPDALRDLEVQVGI